MTPNSAVEAVRRSAPGIALAVVTAFVLCLGLALSRGTTFASRVLVTPQLTGSASTLSPEEADRDLANQIVLAGSAQVAARAAGLLKERDPEALRAQVDVTQVGGTDVLSFVARGGSREQAAARARAMATAYSAVAADRVRVGLTGQAGALQQRLDDLAAVLSTPAGATDAESTARAALRDQYVAVLRQQQDLRAQAAVALPSPVAGPDGPAERVGRSAGQLAAAAAVLVLLAAGLLVVTRARWDGVARTPEDLELPFTDRLSGPQAPARPFARTPAGPVTEPLREAAAHLCLLDPAPSVVAVVDLTTSSPGRTARLVAEELQAMGAPAAVVHLAGDSPEPGPDRPADDPLLTREPADEGFLLRRRRLAKLKDDGDLTVLAVRGDAPLDVVLAADVADVFLLRLAAGTRTEDVRHLVEQVRSVSTARVFWVWEHAAPRHWRR